MSKVDGPKPDVVIEQIRKRIRTKLGDKCENKTQIYATHGYFFVTLPNKKQRILRRSALPAFYKELKK